MTLNHETTIRLKCTEGTSNKFYHIFLTMNYTTGRWDVTTKYGAIGSTPKEGSSFTGLSYTQARKKFDSQLASKKNKGYYDITNDWDKESFRKERIQEARIWMEGSSLFTRDEKTRIHDLMDSPDHESVTLGGNLILVRLKKHVEVIAA